MIADEPFFSNGVMYMNVHLLKMFAVSIGFATCPWSRLASSSSRCSNFGAINSNAKDASPEAATPDRTAMSSCLCGACGSISNSVRVHIASPSRYTGQKRSIVEDEVLDRVWLVYTRKHDANNANGSRMYD